VNKQANFLFVEFLFFPDPPFVVDVDVVAATPAKDDADDIDLFIPLLLSLRDVRRVCCCCRDDEDDADDDTHEAH